jgi:hypothetical protein
MVKSITIASERRNVTVPLTLTMGADITKAVATAKLQVPLSALKQGQITGVALGEPWSKTAPSFEVEDGQLKVEVADSNPGAWAKVAPTLTLMYADGAATLLSVNSPSVTVDDTAFERKGMEENLAVDQELLSFFTARLAQAKGPLPESHTSKQLAEATEAQAAAQKAMDAARPALEEAVRSAPLMNLLGFTAFAPELEAARKTAIDASNAALNGKPESAATRAAAVAVLRDAVLGSDALMAQASKQLEKRDFVSAMNELHLQSSLAKSLGEYLAVETPRREKEARAAVLDSQKSIDEQTAKIAELTKRLASNEPFTRQLPLKQISLF